MLDRNDIKKSSVGSTRILTDLLKDRGFGIVARNHNIYESCGNTRELGTAFIVMGDMQSRVIGWPIDEIMCRFKIQGRFFNFSTINVHSPHSGSTVDNKDAFYAHLECEYGRYPSCDVKIIIGDLNAQVGQEEDFRPTTIGKFSAYQADEPKLPMTY